MILYQTLEDKLRAIGEPTSDYSVGAIEVLEELMEEAQQQRTDLTFGQAMELLKAKPGNNVKREGQGKLTLWKKTDTEEYKPYHNVKVIEEDGTQHIFTPTIDDVTATDWRLV